MRLGGPASPPRPGSAQEGALPVRPGPGPACSSRGRVRRGWAAREEGKKDAAPPRQLRPRKCAGRGGRRDDAARGPRAHVLGGSGRGETVCRGAPANATVARTVKARLWPRSSQRQVPSRRPPPGAVPTLTLPLGFLQQSLGPSKRLLLATRLRTLETRPAGRSWVCDLHGAARGPDPEEDPLRCGRAQGPGPASPGALCPGSGPSRLPQGSVQFPLSLHLVARVLRREERVAVPTQRGASTAGGWGDSGRWTSDY